MGLSVDELKLIYEKELEEVSEPALTYRDKCPLCDQLVCYHISNGDYVLFSHLDSPWEIHECPTIDVDIMYKASVLDLPVNEFKHRIIEGSINYLCGKSSSSKSPYEKAVAETLNISLDRFRDVYKSVCHLYGSRIILKAVVRMLHV